MKTRLSLQKCKKKPKTRKKNNMLCFLFQPPHPKKINKLWNWKSTVGIKGTFFVISSDLPFKEKDSQCYPESKTKECANFKFEVKSSVK